MKANKENRQLLNRYSPSTKIISYSVKNAKIDVYNKNRVIRVSDAKLSKESIGSIDKKVIVIPNKKLSPLKRRLL